MTSVLCLPWQWTMLVNSTWLPAPRPGPVQCAASIANCAVYSAAGCSSCDRCASGYILSPDGSHCVSNWKGSSKGCSLALLPSMFSSHQAGSLPLSPTQCSAIPDCSGYENDCKCASCADTAPTLVDEETQCVECGLANGSSIGLPCMGRTGWAA